MSKVQAVVTNVPYSKLRLGASNARKTGRGSDSHMKKVEAMAASIMRVGLLQNLVVHVSADTEFLDVDAGGTRFEAIGLLIERGDLAADYQVPVLVIGADEATAASLTENVQRSAMHPADELDAFLALTEQGWTIDSIADSFGVTPLVVERRLKLRAAAPALIECFRKGEISNDQLIALCSTDSHERQVAVWERSQNGYRDPNTLRRGVIGSEVVAKGERRLAFIGGLAAYERAGGSVRRDLFEADGNGTILTDENLLNTLVTGKLEEIAEELRCEGWSWVEAWMSKDWTALDRLGRAPEQKGEPTQEETDELAALLKEHSELQAAIDEMHAGDDPFTDEESELFLQHSVRMDDVEARIEELNAGNKGFSAEVKANAGAIVIYHHGNAEVHRGLVRAADRSKIVQVLGEGQQVSGGRTTEPAGRKTDAMSDALRRSLLGHRNLAAQFATAANPRAAKLLLISRMIADMRSQYSEVPSDLEVAKGWGTRTYCPITDEAGKVKEKEFKDLGEQLIAALPKELPSLWDALSELADTDLDNLMAYAVARSVSLNERTEDDAPNMSHKYLHALQFNMAEHFTATAGNYLGRVPKELIIEALREAGKLASDDEAETLMEMKKKALAEEAERRLAGTGWVPGVIRTPVPGSDKPAGKKKGGKGKAPAAA